MTASLSVASGGRHRSRSRPRRHGPSGASSVRSGPPPERRPSRRDSHTTTKQQQPQKQQPVDQLIVDISSIKSSLLARTGEERRRSSPNSPTGGATAYTGATGMTKSTRGTTGTWSSIDDGSSFHRRRDAAAAAVRRNRVMQGDESAGQGTADRRGRSRSRPRDKGDKVDKGDSKSNRQGKEAHKASMASLATEGNEGVDAMVLQAMAAAKERAAQTNKAKDDAGGRSGRPRASPGEKPGDRKAQGGNKREACRRAVERARSRSRPRDKNPHPHSNPNRGEAPVGEAEVHDDLSSLASKSMRSGHAISVAAAATLAAAASRSLERARSRSRPRERGDRSVGPQDGGRDGQGGRDGEGKERRRAKSIPREVRGAFGTGESGEREKVERERHSRPRSSSRPRAKGGPGGEGRGDDSVKAARQNGGTPARRRPSHLSASHSASQSVGPTTTFHHLRHDSDKNQASHDAHHHRRGSRYRNGEGERRGSVSRSLSPAHGRAGDAEDRLEEKNRRHRQRERDTPRDTHRASRSPDSRGGISRHSSGTDTNSRSTVRTMNHDRRHRSPHGSPHRSRSPSAVESRRRMEGMRSRSPGERSAHGRARSPGEKSQGSRYRPPPPRRSSAYDAHHRHRETSREGRASPIEEERPRSQPRAQGHRGRSPLPEEPRRDDERHGQLRGRSQSQPRMRSRSQPRRPLSLTAAAEQGGPMYHDRSRSPHSRHGSRPGTPNSRRGTPGPSRGDRSRGPSPLERNAPMDRSHRTSSRSPSSHRRGTPGPTRRNDMRSRSPFGEDKRGGTSGPQRRRNSRSTSPFTEAKARNARSQSPKGAARRGGGTPVRQRGRQSPALEKLRAASPFARRGGPGAAEEEEEEGDDEDECLVLSAFRRSSQIDNCSASFDASDPNGSRADGSCADSRASRRFLCSEGSAELDPNGCCMYHPYVQLQRPRTGGGWRIMSRTCPMCAEEAEERERRGTAAAMAAADEAVAAALGRLSAGRTPPHPLEREHAQLNTTSGQRRSILQVEDLHVGSVGSSPLDLDDESITPSFLESGSESDDESEHTSDASSMGSQSCSGPLDSLELNSLGEPLSPPDQADDGQSVCSRHAEQPPHHRSRRTSVEDESAQPVDMGRVENALRKIKSMEQMAAIASVAATSENSEASSSAAPPQNKAPSKKSSKKASKSKSKAKGTAGKRRPPPPPPPPRVNSSKSMGNNGAHGANNGNQAVPNAVSMAVLNPHPEPELVSEFPMAEFAPNQSPPPQPGMPQSNFPQHPFPPQGMMEAPTEQQQVDKSKEWMKYTTGFTRRENDDSEGGEKKKSKFKGRVPARHANSEREKIRGVKQMPFTDQFGDFGFYTGQVDEDGRPEGKGSMKYENGVFYEGTWTAGCQDKKAAANYERIRGGFTSWGGKGKSGTKSGMVLPWNARKNDAMDVYEKTNVRGMEWTDLNGDSGRYTGEVNSDQLPHGNGMMKYDFGLIAEGEWVNGVLKEGPQDRMMGMAAAMNGGQSVAPAMINSGMSVGPGANGFAGGAVSVLGNGGISVAPGMGGGMGGAMGGGMSVAPSVYGGGMPMMQYGGMNPMMAMANQSRQATQHAAIAHQNAMMKAGMYGGAGSVYGGAGSVYGGQPMPPMQMQQQQQQQPMMAMQQPQQQVGNKPPVPEIKLG